MNILQTIILFLGMLSISGCSTTTVEDYADYKPTLALEDFFSGQLRADGIVKNRSGKVIRYFTASIDASWDNGKGTLVEDFTFNDGEQQQRVWTLTPMTSTRYKATANDVVGDAELNIAGNSMFLDYVLRVPYKNGTIDLRLDDRMYLISPSVLINETKISKYGFNVGSLILSITRVEQ
jgi:hypothetical protein